MRHTIAVALGVLASGVAGVGCKGETKFKDSQATLDSLEACKNQAAEKDKLIKDYESTIARDEAQGAKFGDIVVTIEGQGSGGSILTVTPAKAGVSRPIDDKAAAAASKVFIDLVSRSRGSIQKCYEQALKKDTSLQARTVTLTVSASFGSSGAYQDSSFSPSLGDAFNTCMHTISTKWSLPTNSPAMTFKAPVSLTPS